MGKSLLPGHEIDKCSWCVDSVLGAPKDEEDRHADYGQYEDGDQRGEHSRSEDGPASRLLPGPLAWRIVSRMRW